MLIYQKNRHQRIGAHQAISFFHGRHFDFRFSMSEVTTLLGNVTYECHRTKTFGRYRFACIEFEKQISLQPAE